MNYFFDTEFLEGVHGNSYLPIIDLISIGIVAEDGREFYAVSNEFDHTAAWKNDWIRENVLSIIYKDCTGSDLVDTPECYHSFVRAINANGMTRKEIASSVLLFCTNSEEAFNEWLGSSDEFFELLHEDECAGDAPVFWAYYASTDWVALYQLWESLMGVPKSFPRYVKCLKNWMDFWGFSKEWKRAYCPDPDGAHNALVDARWNKKLYGLLKNYDDAPFEY